jgi:hypothetical protein
MDLDDLTPRERIVWEAMRDAPQWWDRRRMNPVALLSTIDNPRGPSSHEGMTRALRSLKRKGFVAGSSREGWRLA